MGARRGVHENEYERSYSMEISLVGLLFIVYFSTSRNTLEGKNCTVCSASAEEICRRLCLLRMFMTSIAAFFAKVNNI